MQVDILKRLFEAVVIVHDRETDKDLASGWALWRESEWMPFGGNNSIILRKLALPLVDRGTGQVICIILANKCLVFVITVNDEWW